LKGITMSNEPQSLDDARRAFEQAKAEADRARHELNTTVKLMRHDAYKLAMLHVAMDRDAPDVYRATARREYPSATDPVQAMRDVSLGCLAQLGIDHRDLIEAVKRGFSWEAFRDGESPTDFLAKPQDSDAT
jgi:hypothetical protein